MGRCRRSRRRGGAALLLVVAGRPRELPAALPWPVVLDLQKDVEQAHPLECPRHRNRPASMGRKPIDSANSSVFCLAASSSPATNPSSCVPFERGLAILDANA